MEKKKKKGKQTLNLVFIIGFWLKSIFSFLILLVTICFSQIQAKPNLNKNGPRFHIA